MSTTVLEPALTAVPTGSYRAAVVHAFDAPLTVEQVPAGRVPARIVFQP